MSRLVRLLCVIMKKILRAQAKNLKGQQYEK